MPPFTIRSRNANASRTNPSNPSSSATSPNLNQLPSRNGATSPLPIPTNMRGMRRLEARRGLEESHYLTAKARTAHPNPPVDMRMLDYVSSYDSNLMCAICRSPFVDPVILYDCDHCFCRDCLRQTWTDYNPSAPQGSCPTCRAYARIVGKGAVSKILINILDELVVKCPKHEEGCTAEVKRGAVNDHVNLYCSYGLVDCPSETCDLPIRRKDAKQCLHHGVSCIDCHDTMTVANLEIHWRNECPDRKVPCNLCNGLVFYREFENHTKATCPAISLPCTGTNYGCSFRSKRGDLNEHTKHCTFAKLAPFFEAQKKRQDVQEEEQKLLKRKLLVLEGGFESIEKLIYARPNDVEVHDADPSRIPLLDSHNRNESVATTATASTAGTLDFPPPPSYRTSRDDRFSIRTSASTARPASPDDNSSSTAVLASPQSPQDFYSVRSHSDAFDPPPVLFPSDPQIPYASPVHHLLSLHEALRDEVTRIASALHELDGRHSMLILNENLRLKEEMAYLGAQVSGVMRQVGWLTSARLQAQQAQQSGGEGSAGPGGGQGAVGTAATALRGAARVVNVGREGMGLPRRATDEGRTKL